MHKSLIQPHGGKLIDRTLQGIERQTAFENAHALPRLTLSKRNLADLECIATGVYSPLEGFVDEEEYYNIVNDMRLGSGLAWSIPVTLQVPEIIADKCRLDTEIALVHPNGNILAVMTITSKFKPDQDSEAKKVYGTTEDAHPGVRHLRTEGEVYLGGPITLVNRIGHNDFQDYRFTPAYTRSEFLKRQWNTIVAFQTRNPIHRAHEYITKIALEIVEGLFINPIVGLTKSDDIPASVRMQCYEVLIDKYYPQDRTLLGVFPAAMRYAGPREAILHAIARQNYGCTHFIIGRDHAGVGSYYGTYDAQHIFDEFGPNELAIIPLKFEHAFYCTRTQTMATAKTSPSPVEEQIHLSGTKVREMLSRGKVPPVEFTRPEIAEILVASMSPLTASSNIAQYCSDKVDLTPPTSLKTKGRGELDSPLNSRSGAGGEVNQTVLPHRLTNIPGGKKSMQRQGVTLWFTGLSGSGKTTLATAVERKLKARHCKVELLDGDIVRTNLSKGLGFSKEDRDTNIRRIGFVANLLSRNGVVAITATISPYRAIRDEIRERTENFMEVYVNAPLEICEGRDVKGLYAKARSGEIKHFTGIDDPYEPPLNPEVVCYTAQETIEQSVDKVIAELERYGYIPVRQFSAVAV